MKTSSNSYIPALSFGGLTRFYDSVVRSTTRERTFKQTLLRQADIKSHHRVLDLGCGTGTLALMVKRAHPTAEVFALDADPEALTLARTKAANEGVEVRLDQGLASALPYSKRFVRPGPLHFVFSSSDLRFKEGGDNRGCSAFFNPVENFTLPTGKPISPLMRLAFLGNADARRLRNDGR